MEKWLDCTISPGQFTGEYAVRGNLFDGTEFSMFAEEEDLSFEERPSEDNPVVGRIRVVPGPNKGDILLVTLPQPTFENGQTISVKASQIRDL